MSSSCAPSKTETSKTRRSEPCRALIGSGTTCGESHSLKIMENFQSLYNERLKKVEMVGENSVELKIKTLQDWVRDLTDQNNLLVKTVGELEKDALDRIKSIDHISIHGSPSLVSQNNLQLHEIAEKSQRIQILESDIESLRCAMDEKEALIRSYLEEIDRYEGEITQLRDESDQRIRHYESELKWLSKSLSGKQSTIEGYQQRIEELESLSRDLRNKMGLKNMVDVALMTDSKDDPYSLFIQLKKREKEVEQLQAQLDDLQGSDQTDYESQLDLLRQNLVELQLTSRDVQSALTAEVAEKHDTIIALRRETSQLEEKLRWSDMQTHFKDDIIKQLRKEVKTARAKESLAEMLGLKECPRFQMKDKIEKLNAELEDKQMIISNLEKKLDAAQINELEEKISKLTQQLTSRERDIITLCNKMDYVRRYIKRLRDDEDVSIKCGLEALLHELNEDSEWNKETRKSVTSLTEEVSDSVIVINRVPSRSHSLPDSSLQKPKYDWTGELTWPNLNFYNRNKHGRVADIKPTFPIELCRLEDVKQVQMKLIQNRTQLSKLWGDIKASTIEVSSTSIFNELEEFKEESKGEMVILTQLMTDIDKIRSFFSESSVHENETAECFFSALESKLRCLVEMTKMEYPNRTYRRGEGDTAYSDFSNKLTDSLNLVAKVKSIPCIRIPSELGVGSPAERITNQIEEMQLILSDVMRGKRKCLQRISDLQNKQGQTYCTISKKFSDFDKVVSLHAKHEDTLHTRINFLFSFTEADPSKPHSKVNELRALQEALTAREYELLKRDKTICLLKKSLSKLSMSPSLVTKGSYFEESTTRAQKTVNEFRKEIESTMCKLLYWEEKLQSVEQEVVSLCKNLDASQLELLDIKKSIKHSNKDSRVGRVDTTVGQLEADIKKMISKLHAFRKEKGELDKARLESQRNISSLQSELSSLQEELNEAIQAVKAHLQRVPVSTVKSSSKVKGDSHMVESLRCQVELYRDKAERLEKDLMKRTTLSSETSSEDKGDELRTASRTECKFSSSIASTRKHLEEIRKEMKQALLEHTSAPSIYASDFDDECIQTNLQKKLQELQEEHELRLRTIENQDETIKILEENLASYRSDVKSLEDQLEQLKSDKEAAESESQKAMKELQQKVSGLQAELQKGRSNSVSSKGWVPWVHKQPQQSRHVHDV